VNLVAHHGLQRVGMGSGQRATRGETVSPSVSTRIGPQWAAVNTE
jgi:hypothetical protein